MKNLNVTSMENLNGGLCIGLGNSGQCLPCEAVLQGLNSFHSTDDIIVCIL